MTEQPPLLSVCLITYNHAKFIRQAIESVLMQQVNFTWELVIADDCSTDGTREILLEYKRKHPEFIQLILQEKNVGPAQNWLDLITKPKSKYIAYLEGDDYWTDPLKLQKQVDFLEKHNDFVLSFHDCTKVDEEGKILMNNSLELKIEYLDSRELMLGRYIPSGSVVFRNNLMDWDKNRHLILGVKNGDTLLYSLLGHFGKAYCHKDIKNYIYRIHKGGCWSIRDSEYKLLNSYETLKILMDLSLPDYKKTLLNRMLYRLIKIKKINEDYYYREVNHMDRKTWIYFQFIKLKVFLSLCKSFLIDRLKKYYS